jgi:methylated-DNA-[protein]-cysteine S-methyltransferase
MLRSAIAPTPFGALAVIVDGDVVVASGFAPLAAVASNLPRDFAGQTIDRDQSGLAFITSHIADFCDGDLTAFERVSVRTYGSPFLLSSWKAMAKITPGLVMTYSELATAAGSPAAVRAAGSACARNRLAPFLPCHRVIRTGGALGNYAYGLPLKRALLLHEGWLNSEVASLR